MWRLVSDTANEPLSLDALIVDAMIGDHASFLMIMNDPMRPLAYITGYRSYWRIDLGGSGNDTVLGTGHADLILSGPGVDIVHGRGGHDVIFGGTGADLLFGENGNDALSSAAGEDWLHGGAGSNVLDAGDGDDVLETRWVSLDAAGRRGELLNLLGNWNGVHPVDADSNTLDRLAPIWPARDAPHDAENTGFHAHSTIPEGSH